MRLTEMEANHEGFRMEDAHPGNASVRASDAPHKPRVQLCIACGRYGETRVLGSFGSPPAARRSAPTR